MDSIQICDSYFNIYHRHKRIYLIYIWLLWCWNCQIFVLSSRIVRILVQCSFNLYMFL
jgi:hypothetical protein